jgi:hypothetical protein
MKQVLKKMKKEFVFLLFIIFIMYFVLLKHAFFPIRKAGHFYVVVFSLTKTASVATSLDNTDSGHFLLFCCIVVHIETHGIHTEFHGYQISFSVVL